MHVQDGHADHQAHRARTTDEAEEAVDQERGQDYVEQRDRLDLEALDQFEKLVHWVRL